MHDVMHVKYLRVRMRMVAHAAIILHCSVFILYYPIYYIYYLIILYYLIHYSVLWNSRHHDQC